MKLSDFLFVREGICLFCKEEETWGDTLCPDCLRRLEFHGGVYEYDDDRHCRIAYFYNRFLQGIFRDFKFGEYAELAAPIGTLLADYVLKEELTNYTHIVPVPMHSRVIRQRGYNQVRLMAEELSRHTGIPVTDALVKVKHTREQNKLDRMEREKNLRGAFALNPKVHLKNAQILLLDDIITTGNTMKHAARVLAESRPAEIQALAFTAPRLHNPLPLQNATFLW